MAASKLRLGLIGLGRFWEGQYKPALARLRDRFEVTAVFDQVARRAEIEARLLGCRAMSGLVALVSSPDVDAIAWLAPQWFGAHPIELAARAGKPIYCGVPLPDDPAELDRLERLGATDRPTIMVEFAPRSYPSTIRLSALIATTLGPVRTLNGLIRSTDGDPPRLFGPGGWFHPHLPLADPGQALVDWSRFLFQRSLPDLPRGPAGAATIVADQAETHAGQLVLRGPDDQPVVIALEPGGESPPHFPSFELTTERGSARVTWPDRIAWLDESGRHEETLPAGPPLGEILFDQFFRVVRGLEHSAPTWDDAIAAARVAATFRRILPDETRVAEVPGSAGASESGLNS